MQPLYYLCLFIFHLYYDDSDSDDVKNRECKLRNNKKTGKEMFTNIYKMLLQMHLNAHAYMYITSIRIDRILTKMYVTGYKTYARKYADTFNYMPWLYTFSDI